MKKKVTTAFLTLVSAFGFAQDATPEALPNLATLDVKPAFPIAEKATPNRSFGYVRMGVSDSQAYPVNSNDFLPGFGLGYRLVAESAAFDISASFNRRDVRTEEGRERTYFYTLPKANYLYYISAEKNSSFYAGGGLAWGGVRTQDEREFHGLMPNVAIGYEMNRNAAWRSFVQLDVSQAAVAAIQTGDLPGPYAELSVGAGF